MQSYPIQPMAEELQPLAEAAGKAFEDQLLELRDSVIAGGHSSNDALSIHAHVFAVGLMQVVDAMQKRAAQIIGAPNPLPVEAALGIFLNDVSLRFWAYRRLEETAE